MSTRTSIHKADLFSRFVNWLSSSWPDRPAINKGRPGTDPLSRFVNSISG
jgi:hypothetical protein